MPAFVRRLYADGLRYDACLAGRRGGTSGNGRGRADSQQKQHYALAFSSSMRKRSNFERPAVSFGSPATAHLISLAARAPRRPRLSRRDPERLVAGRHVRRLRTGGQSRHPPAPRAALGDAADSPRFIQTLPRRATGSLLPSSDRLQRDVDPTAAGCCTAGRAPTIDTPASSPIDRLRPSGRPLAVAAAWCCPLHHDDLARLGRHSGAHPGNRSQRAAVFCVGRSAAWCWPCQRDFRAAGRATSSVRAIDGFRGRDRPHTHPRRRDRHRRSRVTVLARLQDVATRSERLVGPDCTCARTNCSVSRT